MASACACAERLTGVRLMPELLEDHGDWLAIGHQPVQSLLNANSWAAVDKANAERQACEEDPRRRSIPNQAVFGEDVYNATNLLSSGWIGWIQLLLLGVAVAPLVAIRLGVGAEHLETCPAEGASSSSLPFRALACTVWADTDDWPHA